MPAKRPERLAQERKTILVVEDHPLLRRGLIALIDDEPDLMVSGQAGGVQAALEAVKRQKPDLLIVDLALEGGDDGLELVKAMAARHPKIPVLVLSMHSETIYGERSLRAGARGFVSKQQLCDRVMVAIRHVLGGDVYMSDTLANRLARQFVGGNPREPGSPLAQLSDRQLQVFRLLGEGHGTRRIAQQLHLSIKTVETHLEHLKSKLDLSSVADLARHATLWVETERQPPRPEGNDRVFP